MRSIASSAAAEWRAFSLRLLEGIGIARCLDKRSKRMRARPEWRLSSILVSTPVARPQPMTVCEKLKPSPLRGHGPLVNDHPIDAEPVAELAEAMREKRLGHGHKDLAAICQSLVNALGLGIAVD
jgi:hypothetical protein